MAQIENEIEYKVTLPESEQEITIGRWSVGELCQLDSYMELLAFGNPDPTQPQPTRTERDMAVKVIVLTTFKATSYEELADKYLGRARLLGNIQFVGNEIVKHELRGWLTSKGWDRVAIDKYTKEDGSWKQSAEIDATPQTKKEGNGKPPLAQKKEAAATGLTT